MTDQRREVEGNVYIFHVSLHVLPQENLNSKMYIQVNNSLFSLSLFISKDHEKMIHFSHIPVPFSFYHTKPLYLP